MEVEKALWAAVAGILLLIGGIVGFGIGNWRSSPAPDKAQFVMPNVSFAITPEGKPVEVNSNWTFFASDYDHDGEPDLWIIKQAGTGTNTTEVHILKGPLFQIWLLHTGTALHETPNFMTPLKAEKQ